ncbi:hypothetical protein C8F04DRAFT_1239411 [Mycena alexandri]|uniref:Uncharacterized protein n=1 Tax=Mycena alexandri TaxID=1745969 RepID=A0AAD6WTL9_9AGAR|nr:hypothetical protein C8F04DRAFT_1239411 [Mycena alexandri]
MRRRPEYSATERRGRTGSRESGVNSLRRWEREDGAQSARDDHIRECVAVELIAEIRPVERPHIQSRSSAEFVSTLSASTARPRPRRDEAREDPAVQDHEATEAGPCQVEVALNEVGHNGEPGGALRRRGVWPSKRWRGLEQEVISFKVLHRVAAEDQPFQHGKRARKLRGASTWVRRVVMDVQRDGNDTASARQFDCTSRELTVKLMKPEAKDEDESNVAL